MLIKASGKPDEIVVNKGVIAVPLLDLLIMGLFSRVCRRVAVVAVAL